MRRFAPILLLLALSVRAEIAFSGMEGSPVVVTPEKSTGLENVYVVDNTGGNGVVSYTASSASANIVWEEWGQLGAAYANPVSGAVQNGNVWTLRLPLSDTGYTITENGTAHYFWVTNYANHTLEMEDLIPEQGSDFCSATPLIFQGNASPIRFYSINGRPTELSREMTLRYMTQEYDETTGAFTTVEKELSLESIGSVLHAPATLCATTFSLSGDRFLTHWNRAMEIESSVVSPMAVDGHTTAVQTERDNSNEQKEESALGGSAPVEITFTAAVTDGAVFRQWEFARDPEFDIPDVTFSDPELTYTFEDAGTTYVRFIAANADGSCQWISDTYQVFVGQSALLCPNAFSPGSTPGVNDEWKVSYKSITSFSCSIFNRWGVKITSFNNPAQGWDGKYKGKLVPSGVYYYVIKATGADGKKYNLSGDINIINSTYTGAGSSAGE